MRKEQEEKVKVESVEKPDLKKMLRESRNSLGGITDFLKNSLESIERLNIEENPK